MTTTLAGGALVVGYGNPLCGDDGVGPAVAEALAADPRLTGVGEAAAGRSPAGTGGPAGPAAVEVRAAHQLTPELALDASRVALLVLVDADADAGLAPGAVRVRRLDPADGGGDVMTHHVDPAGILGLAAGLWGHAPDCVIVSIGAASFELGEGLSPAVAAAVPAAVDAVLLALEDVRGA
jgi:hydrogenase maturation protease